MTPQEAWAIIEPQIQTDCGPWDEGWDSEELTEAREVFHRLYAPHRTLKAIFPDSPSMWVKSDREALEQAS